MRQMLARESDVLEGTRRTVKMDMSFLKKIPIGILANLGRIDLAGSVNGKLNVVIR